MLYLIATPLGNLADISERALQTLQSSDYILCEDTRRSRILLNHYGIEKRLKSYHKFNEGRLLNELLSDLKQGLTLSLISDAGTPGISDPGQDLVAECHKADIPVSAVPGPCAAILALSLSGFSSERFQYIGFLPKKLSELKKALKEAFTYPGTTIAYESPLRLKKTLQELVLIDSKRKVCVAREMTKKFEEVKLGSAEELLAHFMRTPPKGEIVLLIEEGTEEIKDWSDLSPQEHVALVQKEYGLTLGEAIKAVAKLRETSKSVIYKAVHLKP